MSLIFGVNLHDRLYLAADTRLKNLKNGQFKDKLIKIEPISRDMIIAAAGNANMASYVVRRLLKEENFTKKDVRFIRNNIQKLLAPIIDQYWAEQNDKAEVCFIFGGLNRNEKKHLDCKKIYSKIIEFSKNDNGNSSMAMKKTLFNVFQPGKYSLPEPCDSHIFSVEISPPNVFRIDDANWGYYLAFGPKGITKHSLPKITFGKLEFEARENSIIHDNMVITALMKEVAEKYQAETIGGAIFISVIGESGLGVLLGRINRISRFGGNAEFISEVFQDRRGRFYRKDKQGTIYKLISLKEYKDFGSLEI